ncbi:MAG: sigma 54-interacting transcriptional regulator [Candidatus Marinimicrobia bacterium]|nr:sigma 54-interacting transcriptional regulator [Candidatus Neomarinimicrobiota bacterium]
MIENQDNIKTLAYLTINESHEPLIWLDPTATIRHLNKAACQFYNKNYNNITGLQIYDLHPKQDEEFWQKQYSTLEEKESLRFEEWYKNENDTRIRIRMTLNLLEFCEEEHIVILIEDRTEEYTIKQKVIESERKLSTLISNLPGMAYRCRDDENWTMEFVSDGCKELTGYNSQDLIGNKKLAYSKIIIPEDREKIREKIEEQIQKNSHFEVSYRIKTSSGEIRWLWERGLGIAGQDGSIVAIEGFITDITNMKNTERELIEKRRALRKLKDRLKEETIYLREEIKLNSNFENIISRSDNFKKVLKKVEQVAATDSTVLIQGETGTGKELIARAIHNNSNRSDRSLVTINCAALPSDIIESELFGHKKGAFTGAYSDKIGRFELADQGTIFLDEIGDMPKNVQVKILRVLQEGEFEQLGSSETIKTDARIIAATNRDLEKAVQNGDFREDLYYRLNVFPIYVPPLRERKEDIPLLVQHFVQKYAAKTGREIRETSKEVIEKLTEYNWPGNVRELENIIERAVIVSPGKRLTKGEWLPENKIEGQSGICTLEENVRQHILKALQITNWQVGGDKGAAKLLGMKRTTLQSRMEKLGIERP